MFVTEELSEMAREILGVLRTSGTWLGRAELAELLGRNRLNPNDVRQLDRLDKMELIEVRKVDRPGAITYELQYRAK